MFRNCVILFVAVAMTPHAFAVPKTRGGPINGVFYFTDTTVPRTRAQALAYCVPQGGELAKINGSLFRLLQVVTPTNGGYWVDGIDKMVADRFQLDQHCTTGSLDFIGVPAANLDIPALSCLSFNRASTIALSKIQAVACTQELSGVLCSYPEKGCIDPTIPFSG